MPQIMLVDDSGTFRKQVKKLLETSGYSVIEAENGVHALKVLGETTSKIDLMLCDVNMPEMDGLSLCKKIHENDTYNKIPIMMLTTEANPEIMAKGKEVGVFAWITKPFNEEKFIKTLAKVVSK